MVETPTAPIEPEPESVTQPEIAPELPETVVQPQATPDLDPEILVALGESTEDAPKFGPPIHENLAKIWQQILKKGVPKEAKEKLLNEYSIPENCPLLQAPKLNVEIAAAITDMSRNRDKKIESAQQQLGVGIAAINRALTILVTSDEKVQAIKLISDGCRILSDLHFTETQVRTKMLLPGLEKSFLNIIKDAERDDTLFGSKLSDQIKASKVIEKQGLQIKKTVPAPKTPAPTVQATNARPRYQENWMGPPRYATTSRGGRGGYRGRFNLGPRRPQLPPHNKPSTQSKPRAPAQQ